MVVAKARKKTRELKAADSNTGTIQLRIVDGTRKVPLPATPVLVRIRDGFQKELHVHEYAAGNLPLFRVPFHDNLQDRYTVLASAKGHVDVGFHPVHVTPSVPAIVSLMLLPKAGKYEFSGWETAQNTHPHICEFLSRGIDEDTARQRFDELRNGAMPQQSILAALLNIAVAMSQLQLPQGTPLTYFSELQWDTSMQRDRFFGYADVQLIAQVKAAAQRGVFEQEPGAGLFHPGATLSYKEKQFGEANVQLTFHENDTKRQSGKTLVKVEADIDYFSDKAAHTLLEVIPNALSQGKTDPKQVYVLRWIAGQQAGIPEFNPPYVIRR